LGHGQISITVQSVRTKNIFNPIINKNEKERMLKYSAKIDPGQPISTMGTM